MESVSVLSSVKGDAQKGPVLRASLCPSGDTARGRWPWTRQPRCPLWAPSWTGVSSPPDRGQWQGPTLSAWRLSRMWRCSRQRGGSSQVLATVPETQASSSFPQNLNSLSREASRSGAPRELLTQPGGSGALGR